VKWVARIVDETEQERRAREEQSEREFVKLAETEPEWAEKERRVYEHLMTTPLQIDVGSLSDELEDEWVLEQNRLVPVKKKRKKKKKKKRKKGTEEEESEQRLQAVEGADDGSDTTDAAERWFNAALERMGEAGIAREDIVTFLHGMTGPEIKKNGMA
jgi:hypothetical protein